MFRISTIYWKKCMHKWRHRFMHSFLNFQIIWNLFQTCSQTSEHEQAKADWNCYLFISANITSMFLLKVSFRNLKVLCSKSPSRVAIYVIWTFSVIKCDTRRYFMSIQYLMNITLFSFLFQSRNICTSIASEVTSKFIVWMFREQQTSYSSFIWQKNTCGSVSFCLQWLTWKFKWNIEAICSL